MHTVRSVIYFRPTAFQGQPHKRKVPFPPAGKALWIIFCLSYPFANMCFMPRSAWRVRSSFSISEKRTWPSP